MIKLLNAYWDRQNGVCVKHQAGEILGDINPAEEQRLIDLGVAEPLDGDEAAPSDSTGDNSSGEDSSEGEPPENDAGKKSKSKNK